MQSGRTRAHLKVGLSYTSWSNRSRRKQCFSITLQKVKKPISPARTAGKLAPRGKVSPVGHAGAQQSQANALMHGRRVDQPCCVVGCVVPGACACLLDGAQDNRHDRPWAFCARAWPRQNCATLYSGAPIGPCVARRNTCPRSIITVVLGPAEKACARTMRHTPGYTARLINTPAVHQCDCT